MTEQKNGKKKRRLRGWCVAAVLIFAVCTAGAAAAYAVYSGRLQLNPLYIGKDDIVGCDVSHYQGEIQWDELRRQNIKFTFIKATEGSRHVDQLFSHNWDEVFKTDIKAGAYHFFSFESPGSSQAGNYIRTVKKRKGMLPPVVDIEFYGNTRKNKPDASKVREELNQFIRAIEQEYHTKPIIYTTIKAYDYFIKGYYDGEPLWIRNVRTKPGLNGNWLFWQYTNRGRLKGYSGTEPYIDLNVFHGTERELEQLQSDF